MRGFFIENRRNGKMKKIVMTVCAVAISAVAAQAQTARTENNYAKNIAGKYDAKIVAQAVEMQKQMAKKVDVAALKAAKEQAKKEKFASVRQPFTLGADYYACQGGNKCVNRPAAKKTQTCETGEYVSPYQKCMDKALEVTPEQMAKLQVRAEQEQKSREEAQRREAAKRANEGRMLAEAIANVTKAGK